MNTEASTLKDLDAVRAMIKHFRHEFVAKIEAAAKASAA